MTSPIPMMTGSLLDGGIAYFTNCFTDIDGYVEKINSLYSDGWVQKNDSSNQCFDVKLNYAKYNLLYKSIDINNTSTLSNKVMYLVNSLKMPMIFCSNQYINYFNKTINGGEYIDLYKQEKSEIFDEEFMISDKYTCILFITSSLNSKPFSYKNEYASSEFIPQKGSLVILPPGTEYRVNGLIDEDHYYAVYQFSDII